MNRTSRIGRRTIYAVLLIVALLIIWQVLGAAWDNGSIKF
jgi:hypothetical protein